MRWLRTLILVDKGDVISSSDWESVHGSIVRSIQSVDFPEGSGTLTLRRKHKRKDGQFDRNGVKYLKFRFLRHMVDVEGWTGEDVCELNRPPAVLLLYPSLATHSEPVTSGFGKFDFTTRAPGGTHVAIEWETGNISSSHRSLNKLALALASGVVQVAVLVVPSRALYEHLTDRVGNIGELSGYLEMWQSLGAAVGRGVLAICVVEHDGITDDSSFPYLPSGKDGRSSEGRSKRS